MVTLIWFLAHWSRLSPFCGLSATDNCNLLAVGGTLFAAFAPISAAEFIFSRPDRQVFHYDFKFYVFACHLLPLVQLE